MLHPEQKWLGNLFPLLLIGKNELLHSAEKMLAP